MPRGTKKRHISLGNALRGIRELIAN
ncbi:MAG: hypothetical protein ACI8TX_003580, partial [Hyphomicrobiaceae bacterium]